MPKWIALPFFTALGFAACQRPAPPLKIVDEGVVIEDVTVLSPDRQAPLEHAAVAVRNGRIAAIGTDLVAGPQARRIDGRRRFLIPGLIDSHVHPGHQGPLDDAAIGSHPELLAAYREQLPRAFLAFGFTTLVDLDLEGETRAWFDAAPAHPRLYHCGRGVRIAGGYGAQRVPAQAADADAANLLYEPGQAERWPATLDPAGYTAARAAERVAEAGGICLKTFVEPGFGGAFHWPVPRPETLAALREAAHRRGLVFVVHANGVDSWRAALDAGADVIAHGLWHWPGDRMGLTPPAQAAGVIESAARAKVFVQPTLQAVYGDESVFDSSLLRDPHLAEALPRSVVAYLQGEEGQAARRAVAGEYRLAVAELFAPASPDPATAMLVGPIRATATLRLMLAQRVKLLFGSDTPANEGIGNPPGLNGLLELRRWFEAGVPLSRIFRASTLDNAAAFGLSKELGSIEVGKRADLLLLRANPLESIAAYGAIETVFLNGEPLPRKSLLPAP
ncbi:MAG TPA: amidohydrolase family protein [Candidatus Polarisedimenticolia bacterium]|jgi:imidazolonepropionase-like amidohydrolase|nr:amidohydrolase family protein [Candidatus Polarisedimenticolia bacterium]